MEWRWRIEDATFVLRLMPLPPGLAEFCVTARTLTGAVPVRPPHAVAMRQVHGTRVAWVEGAEADPVPGCDALRTAASDVLLTVRTADCLPVVLASPGEGIAVLHAGWRGLAGGIVESVLSTFRHPEDLHAVLGPAIGPCCFEVGPEVADRFPGSVVRPRNAPRPHVDLPGDAIRRLRSAGLAPRSIVPGPGCTRCNQHLLPSHRGSGGDGSRFLTGARFDSRSLTHRPTHRHPGTGGRRDPG